MTEANITVYGAPWCPDCTRAKQFLGEQRVRYNWVDIDQDEDARAYVQQVNDGKQIIPTIIFEDGSLLVEPSNAELAAKLRIQPKARRDFYDLIVGRWWSCRTVNRAVRRARGNRDARGGKQRNRRPGWRNRAH